MVLQLFRLGGKFPTYEQMKEQAYKAIVNGAHGLLWWGFVYSVGMEGETYQFHDAQAYQDFRRISREVMALEPALVSPAPPELLASVSDSGLEFLVKSHSKQIIVFASNFGETPIARVSFTLASAVPQVSAPVEVYSENRILQLQDHTFSDSFGPYECHVYIIKLQ
jgi:hypothetical protein